MDHVGDHLLSESESLMRFFTSAHLPEKLKKVSSPFCELARKVVTDLPDNYERTTALRKLLEAKDCAVRSIL